MRQYSGEPAKYFGQKNALVKLLGVTGASAIRFFHQITIVLGGHLKPNQVLRQCSGELAKYFGQKNALVKLLGAMGVSATRSS